MNKYQWIQWIMIFHLLFFSSGCWSAYEVDNRIFITGIFVDLGKKPNEVELTLMTPIPHQSGGETDSEGEEQKKSFAFITKQGKTLEDAVEKIEENSSRKLTWGHSRVIVVGRPFAKAGMKHLFDWFTRQSHMRLRHQIMIASGTAKEFTEVTPIFEPSPADILQEVAKKNQNLKTFVLDFIKPPSTNQDTIAPIIMLNRHDETTSVKLKGSAFFQQHKMVGSINQAETTALSWAKGDLKNFQLTIPREEHSTPLGVELEDLHSQLRPIIQDEKIIFQIKLDGKARITTSTYVANPTFNHQIQQQVSEKIKKDLLSALKKSQNAQADILQLGSLMDWWYPQRWHEVNNNWNHFYQDQVEFEIKPTIRFQDFGLQKPSNRLK